jgi:hypothetical protein
MRVFQQNHKVCLTLSFPSAPDEALLVGIIEAILANFSDASCFYKPLVARLSGLAQTNSNLVSGFRSCRPH